MVPNRSMVDGPIPYASRGLHAGRQMNLTHKCSAGGGLAGNVRDARQRVA